jgi:hypothetical protein
MPMRKPDFPGGCPEDLANQGTNIPLNFMTFGFGQDSGCWYVSAPTSKGSLWTDGRLPSEQIRVELPDRKKERCPSPGVSCFAVYRSLACQR